MFLLASLAFAFPRRPTWVGSVKSSVAGGRIKLRTTFPRRSPALATPARTASRLRLRSALPAAKAAPQLRPRALQPRKAMGRGRIRTAARPVGKLYPDQIAVLCGRLQRHRSLEVAAQRERQSVGERDKRALLLRRGRVNPQQGVSSARCLRGDAVAPVVALQAQSQAAKGRNKGSTPKMDPAPEGVS